MSSSLPIAQKLGKSRLFQDYQSAFESATRLPLSLQQGGARPGTLAQRPGGNPFCLLMAKSNQSCAACASMQQKIEEQASIEPKSLHCFAGLCESAVPVRVGKDTVAFLQTGQVLLHRPDARQFSKVAKTLIEMGTEVDLKRAEEAWFATTVLTAAQYEAMLRLLNIFATHLSQCANALSMEAQNVEPAAISKAKTFVKANCDDGLTLGRVARAVNMSAGYFSQLFHQNTGLTFTEFVARVRIEKVKNLLSNPRLQITTIAYDTGFKSLSQFNRVFKRLCGESPRSYRLRHTVTGVL